MHLRLMRSIAIAVCCTTFAANTAYASKLLRYPDIHEDQVVFTQGGDLWIASVGEVAPARRLTTHPGLELFAKFSPDGKWVAFTAQYDGDEQVYVVPSEGGEPKRLTYYPAGRPRPTRGGWEHQVFGWAPTGKEVLFKSSRDSWKGSRLFTVPIDGGLPQSLEPPLAGSGDFSPDGHRLFYAPLSRDFRTWKRYEGGWAQDLYIYDLKAKTVEQITSHKRTDRDPMWIKDRVAFASDRDGRLNLYSYDLATKKTVQLTHYEKVDVRWPSTDGKGKIVYELEGQLHVYDLEKGEVQALQIRVPSESISARPRLVNVEKYIESFALSPKAKRALFVARGDVFSLPIKKGVMRNLTRSSNAHDREAQWSPDGKSVSYISDAGGEEAVWLLELETGKAKQLTTGHQARLYHPRWSPDGQYIAYGDKEGCIYVISVDGGEPQLVVDEPGFPLRDWVWSPRGGFLAFTQSDVNNFRSIYIYGVRNEKVYRVTGGQFNEFSPAWSPEGE
nr:peptidase S41 [Myxococcales bacterium]